MNEHFVLFCSSCSYMLPKDCAGPNWCQLCHRKLFLAEGTDQEIDLFIEQKMWP